MLTQLSMALKPPSNVIKALVLKEIIHLIVPVMVIILV